MAKNETSLTIQSFDQCSSLISINFSAANYLLLKSQILLLVQSHFNFNLMVLKEATKKFHDQALRLNIKLWSMSQLNLPITFLFRDIGIPLHKPHELFSDSMSALQMFINLIFHAITNIKLDYHFVRQKVALGSLITHYMSSHEQLVDFLTRPLPKAMFHKFGRKLGVRALPTSILRTNVKEHHRSNQPTTSAKQYDKHGQPSYLTLPKDSLTQTPMAYKSSLTRQLIFSLNKGMHTCTIYPSMRLISYLKRILSTIVV